MMTVGRCLRWLLCLCVGLVVQHAAGADFNVTSPGSFYSFNGTGSNPTLTLIRGETYTFAVATGSLHPFQIASPGATPSGGISSGTITYKVPTNAMNYTYRCTIHGFFGTIVTVPPPVFRIVRLDVKTNLVLK